MLSLVCYSIFQHFLAFFGVSTFQQLAKGGGVGENLNVGFFATRPDRRLLEAALIFARRNNFSREDGWGKSGWKPRGYYYVGGEVGETWNDQIEGYHFPGQLNWMFFFFLSSIWDDIFQDHIWIISYMDHISPYMDIWYIYIYIYIYIQNYIYIYIIIYIILYIYMDHIILDHKFPGMDHIIF